MHTNAGLSGETPESVRHFWFGSEPDDLVTAQQQAKLWWSKNPAVDEEIRVRFGDLMDAAASHELKDWEKSPEGLLALILLTDQFPRNSYRGTPKSFAFDAIARKWCRSGIEAGADRMLRPIERVFFYLPLEHSESLADQVLAVKLYSQLVDEASANRKEGFAGFLEFARRHMQIIERFGRFPHRNKILDRLSTADEEEFLLEAGSSF